MIISIILINLNVSLQVQTVLKKVPVVVQNQTEPILVNRKKLEYKWGMNVLGESVTADVISSLKGLKLSTFHFP